MNYYLSAIYMDKFSNILIIPTVQDQNGVRRDYNFPIQVKQQYEPETLYNKVRESLLVAEQNTPYNVISAEKVYESVTGIKGFKAFSKGRKYVAVMYNQEAGYKVIPSKRESDGSYSFLRDKQRVVESNVSACILESIIMDSFIDCK